MSNPLRVKILGLIATEPATTAELTARIGASRAAIGYHTKVLCNSGCARIVEQAEPSSLADRLFEADR